MRNLSCTTYNTNHQTVKDRTRRRGEEHQITVVEIASQGCHLKIDYIDNREYIENVVGLEEIYL